MDMPTTKAEWHDLEVNDPDEHSVMLRSDFPVKGEDETPAEHAEALLVWTETVLRDQYRRSMLGTDYLALVVQQARTWLDLGAF